jgi:response regulator RpfG family c-di-GMP phosphodiesterase
MNRTHLPEVVVLAVDDVPENLTALQALLAQSGVRLITAARTRSRSCCGTTSRWR